MTASSVEETVDFVKFSTALEQKKFFKNYFDKLYVCT